MVKSNYRHLWTTESWSLLSGPPLVRSRVAARHQSLPPPVLPQFSRLTVQVPASRLRPPVNVALHHPGHDPSPLTSAGGAYFILIACSVWVRQPLHPYNVWTWMCSAPLVRFKWFKRTRRGREWELIDCAMTVTTWSRPESENHHQIICRLRSWE